MANQYSIYGCINLFNHSPFEEHTDLFKLLSITNKDDMNIHVQVHVWTYILPFIIRYLGVEYLGQIVDACLTLQKTAEQLLKLLYYSISPQGVFESSGLLHTQSFPNFRHSGTGVQRFLFVVLNCIFLMANGIKYFVSCTHLSSVHL